MTPMKIPTLLILPALLLLPAVVRAALPSDWIDPDTGMLAEDTPVRLEDH